MAMTEPLHTTRWAYEEAKRVADDALRAHHAAIRSAHANGATYRELAERLGVSFQRIAQICKTDERTGR